MQSTREASQQPVADPADGMDSQPTHEVPQQPVAAPDDGMGPQSPIRHEASTERGIPSGRARRSAMGWGISRTIRQAIARAEAEAKEKAEARRLARMNSYSTESNTVPNPASNLEQDATGHDDPVPSTPSSSEQDTTGPDDLVIRTPSSSEQDTTGPDDPVIRTPSSSEQDTTGPDDPVLRTPSSSEQDTTGPDDPVLRTPSSSEQDTTGPDDPVIRTPSSSEQDTTGPDDPVLRTPSSSEQDTTGPNDHVLNPASNAEHVTTGSNDNETGQAKVEQHANQTGQSKNGRREWKKRQRLELRAQAAEARQTRTERREPESREQQNEPEHHEHQIEPVNREHENEPVNREHEVRDAEHHERQNEPENGDHEVRDAEHHEDQTGPENREQQAREAEYNYLLAHPEHPFWELPAGVAGAPAQNLSGARTVAENPSSQPLVTAMELAFNNLALYADGYSNYQHGPQQLREARPAPNLQLRPQAPFAGSHSADPAAPRRDDSHVPRMAPEATNPQQPQQPQQPTSGARPSWVDPSFPLPSESSPSGGEPFFTFTPLSSRYRFRDLERAGNLVLPTTPGPGEANAFLRASRATNERRRQMAREILNSTGWEGLDLKGQKKKK